MYSDPLLLQLATGCGPVLKGTYNEAVHIALLEGLKVRQDDCVQQLVATAADYTRQGRGVKI